MAAVAALLIPVSRSGPEGTPRPGARTAGDAPGAGPAPVPVHAYLDAPPVARTGGFGEPTCRECHFDYPLNEPGGSLRVLGAPTESALAGAEVDLTVQLARSGMGRAGMELSARYASGPAAGSQAGRFRVEGDRLETARGEDDPDVVYLRHTGAGSRPTTPDTARWRFRWVAPTEPVGPVVLHVAANAANDDASEFGDRIYADSVVVPMATAPGSR